MQSDFTNSVCGEVKALEHQLAFWQPATATTAGSNVVAEPSRKLPLNETCSLNAFSFRMVVIGRPVA